MARVAVRPTENHAPTLAESSACCPSITPLRLGVLKPIVRFMGRYRNNASRLAGLLSALYLALLLCTPWIIRSLLCCSRHLLPFPHKRLVGRRLRLSKHFEQPYARGTELGNDESRLAGYVMRTKYGVFNTTLKALRSRYFVLHTSAKC